MNLRRFLAGATPLLLLLLLSLSSLLHAHDINSINAPAPSPDPSQLNLTRLMFTRGCKAFAEALTGSVAGKVFDDDVEGGLTVFCPNDDIFEEFLPNYKNLTAPGKTSVLEYHGVPIYMSVPILKSNNGVTNTLATDGANKYEFTIQNDGEEVTIKTNVVTAKITGTVFDKPPLVVYLIDKVLEPEELFKADAPTPSPAADSPNVASSPAAESPTNPPDDSPEDQAADSNSAVRVDGGKSYMAAAALGAWLGFSLL